MPLRTLAIALLLVSSAFAHSARAASVILNTLEGSDDHAPGWSGGVNGLFSGSGGNTDHILIAVGERAQWRGARHRWQLRSSYGYEESDRRTTARNFIAHLRHNYDIVPVLATVAFVQVQENAFQKLKSRWLVGAGLRGDLVDGDRNQVRVGVTPMLEMERLEGASSHIARGRLSTFVQLSRRFNDDIRLGASGFLQPLFTDFRDYRATGVVSLVVGLTDSLGLSAGASVETDTRPPPAVEKTDWSTFTSLTVKI